MEAAGATNKSEAVIIDNGSGLMKVGMAGEDVPRSIFPTIIGKPKMPGLMVGVDQKDVYIGSEVKEKKSILKVDTPIVKGIIQDWDDMKKIWQYAIVHEMRTVPEEQELLLTEPPLNPKSVRSLGCRRVLDLLLNNFCISLHITSTRYLCSLCFPPQ